MKHVGETKHRHRVGMCPSCRDYLWAEVDVATEVSEPTMSEDGKCTVFVNARPVPVRLSHDCDRREDEGVPTESTSAPTAENEPDGPGADEVTS